MLMQRSSYNVQTPAPPAAVPVNGLAGIAGHMCGNCRQHPQQLAGLGAFDFHSAGLGAGLTVGTVATVGLAFVVYLLLFGNSAKERTRQLAAAKQEYNSKVASIKRKYGRLRTRA